MCKPHENKIGSEDDRPTNTFAKKMSKDTRITAEDLEVSGFFWVPSFEAYGSVAGLYDLGPTGCAIERNLLQKWREFFILEDDMLEVRCSALTPRPVLDASGHTSKFSDYMLTDLVNAQLYRADQYIAAFLKEKIEKCKDEAKKHEMTKDMEDVDGMTRQGLIDIMAKYQVKSPEGNDLSTPEAFNLMFGTRIGPGARSIEAYLRPETAQGIFVNFPRLFHTNRDSLPFAAAQVGMGYRNEISPRNGLVRCREFQMAEIEHFADPEKLNDFPKFDLVKDVVIKFFPAPAQEDPDESKRVMTEMTLQEAFDKNIIPHKTMGYYIGRVFLFLCELGIKPETIRFRQHRPNEKAHYSRDCWDAEINTASLGWLECVGIADRQSFDLTRHSQFTAKKGEGNNSAFTVSAPLDTPIKQHKLAVVGEKGALGKAFRKEAAAVQQALAEFSEEKVKEVQSKLAEAEALLGGKPDKKKVAAAIAALDAEKKAKFEELTKLEVAGKVLEYGMYNVVDEDVVITTRQFIPNVIEPSMGVGRVMTCLFEQAFNIREDRRILSLRPFMAPYKVVLLPISSKMIPAEMMHNIRNNLRKNGLASQIDAAGVSIGKRYARADELGTPFAITMDEQTVKNGAVTLRERDSTKQVRGNIDEIIKAIVNLVNGTEKWEDITKRFDAVVRPEK